MFSPTLVHLCALTELTHQQIFIVLEEIEVPFTAFLLAPAIG